MSSLDEEQPSLGEPGPSNEYRFDLDPVDLDAVDWDSLALPSLPSLQGEVPPGAAQVAGEVPQAQSQQASPAVTAGSQASDQGVLNSLADSNVDVAPTVPEMVSDYLEQPLLLDPQLEPDSEVFNLLADSNVVDPKLPEMVSDHFEEPLLLDPRLDLVSELFNTFADSTSNVDISAIIPQLVSDYPAEPVVLDPLLDPGAEVLNSLADSNADISAIIPGLEADYPEEPLLPEFHMDPGLLSAFPEPHATMFPLLSPAGPSQVHAASPSLINNEGQIWQLGEMNTKQQRANGHGTKRRQNPSQLPQPVLGSEDGGSEDEASEGRPMPPAELAIFLNDRHTPNSQGRLPDHRGLKDTTVANDFYYSIKQLPAVHLPDSQKTISYSGVEIEGKTKFTGAEFLEYLQCLSRGPDHGRRPVLRIQFQPSQYNHRYPRGGASFKCRFKDCADKHGTILKGQARVCIQEFIDERGDWLNPFHNAGYVHLYCLERQVNFIELCQSEEVLVVAESRNFQHEPPSKSNARMNNPMMLNDVERGVMNKWRQEIGKRWHIFRAQHPDERTRPHFALWNEDMLFHRLTKAHLDNPTTQALQRKRKRDAAGRTTAHLDQFVGDVSQQADLMKKMRSERHGQHQGHAAVASHEVVTKPSRKKRRTSRVQEYDDCEVKDCITVRLSSEDPSEV